MNSCLQSDWFEVYLLNATFWFAFALYPPIPGVKSGEKKFLQHVLNKSRISNSLALIKNQ
jgi:hypothetical protein